jgi:spore coat polysaccharide biosynthesis predicted glycosyltransferase SpsG
MNQKKSILFRISGGRSKNKEFGLGHIYRAVNLAEYFDKFTTHFLIEDYGGALQVLTKNGKKKIHVLNPGISLDMDIKKTAKLIEDEGIDLLIVDKFDKITKSYVSKMKKIVKTVVIADTSKIDYNADLVINGFIGFPNSIIKNRFNTKCLLGPKYQILSKNYEKNNKKFKNPQKVLVTLGGYDNQKIIESFCKQITPFLTSLKIKIILGAATKRSKALSKLDSNFNNLSVVNSVPNLKKDIKNAKFGFCGGGITTYEFAILQVPFAIICQYKHQIKTAQAWNKKEMALNLGYKNKLLEKNLEKIFVKISKNEINVNNNPNFKMDGFGGKRIAKYLLKNIFNFK